MSAGAMNRREAIILLAAGLGGTIFGARRLLAGAPTPGTSASPLSAADLILLNEVAETILPATPKSEGAKAANVAAFMDDMVRTFYEDDERAAFLAGLGELQAASRDRFGGRMFLDLAPDERLTLLLGLEASKPQPRSYAMIKQMTIFGYFTSEIGATQAMAHVAVPGRFDGIVKIPPGTRAWSY
jgi:hypothetical protein